MEEHDTTNKVALIILRALSDVMIIYVQMDTYLLILIARSRSSCDMTCTSDVPP